MAILNNNAIVGASGQSTGPFKIERSLRFNSADSAYLSRTTWGTPTNRKKGTISFWVKRSELGSSSRYLVYSYNGSASNSFGIYFVSDNTLEFQFGGSSAKNIRTSAVFRDPSAWYHLVFAWDTTDATAANRTKIYVNNVEQTLGTTNYPSQNDDAQFPATTDNYIGYTSSITFGGYLTEINFIDGSALTPSSFGETDTDTGVWKPKAYSGSYGTNGFYLKFADNSGTTSTTLGKDSSGNGNNWTPNNFSVTAGAGNDSLVDTPTPYGTDTGAGGEVRGNYCTLSPLQSDGGTLSNGNLDYATSTATVFYSIGTIGVPSGKWYFEVRRNSGNSAYPFAGVFKQGGSVGSYLGSTADAWTLLMDGNDNGKWRTNGTLSSNRLSDFVDGDIAMVAVDVDAGKVWFGRNGTWAESGVPASGTNAQYTNLSGTIAPAIAMFNAAGATVNFGQRAFAYTAPSGFKALCTTNLPTPAIGATASTQAGKYFDAVIWSANGSGAVDRTITSTFQPDMIWSKTRSAAYHNNIFDAVRGFGSNIALVTDQAWSEGTASGGRIKSVASTSFTWEAGGSAAEWYNQSSNTYISWIWNAGGSNQTISVSQYSSNVPSIASTVRANTTAGFSIVTYTGTGANATVGHGLGVAPSMIIVKCRNAATSWRVYHTSIGNTGAIYFNLPNATETNSVFWNNTSPTSSVFTVGTDPGVNGSSNTFVAYCFAPVAGYSAFGSYTGNDVADGPMVFTGFRPRYVLIKSSTVGTNWYVLDSSRSPYNESKTFLYPSSAIAEDVLAYGVDFLSNGFKVRAPTGYGLNNSGATYIYAAFAENPFKYSLAR